MCIKFDNYLIFCDHHLQEDWVLCRIIYKSSSSPQNLCDHSTPCDTSPNLAASPTSEHALLNNTHQNMINSIYQGQNPNLNPNTYPVRLGYLHMYPEELDEEVVSHPSASNRDFKLIETKCEDDFGFLFDMSIDYSDGRDGVASYVEEVGFDNVSSSVFI